MGCSSSKGSAEDVKRNKKTSNPDSEDVCAQCPEDLYTNIGKSNNSTSSTKYAVTDVNFLQRFLNVASQVCLYIYIYIYIYFFFFMKKVILNIFFLFFFVFFCLFCLFYSFFFYMYCYCVLILFCLLIIH